MGASTLGSRAIIGEFYQALESVTGYEWLDQISMLFNSNQESETYKWLGMSPPLREWIGGRQAKGFRENGITIVNKTYESTLEVLVDELRRDKTDQILMRIGEQADRAVEHWAKLLTTLIEGGETGLCYDGQCFFDTDHTEGDSGTQDNDLAAGTLTALDITTATAPTVAEAEAALMGVITHMLGFKDDTGEPMNANARSFLAMVPVTMFGAFVGAIDNQVIGSNNDNRIMKLKQRGFSIDVAVNPRSTWTANFAVFRTDGRAKPLIRQEEEGLTIQAIAEDSEEEFKNNRHLYGVKAIRNVGYGYWQHACLALFS